MSSKSEVIAKVVPTTTYLGSFVRTLINEVTCEDALVPTSLKKGDVIKTYSGVKTRPCVVVSVYNDYVISIPLTSTESVHCMSESDSRFFGKGWFCNSYVITPIDLAFESFIGVYDNNKVLNNAIRELKLFISSSF